MTTPKTDEQKPKEDVFVASVWMAYVASLEHEIEDVERELAAEKERNARLEKRLADELVVSARLILEISKIRVCGSEMIEND